MHGTLPPRKGKIETSKTLCGSIPDQPHTSDEIYYAEKIRIQTSARGKHMTMRISSLWPALLLFVSASCSTTGELSDCLFCAKRTYRVLDAMTEQPIPDVDVQLSKTTTIPGPGSPGVLSHKTESMKTDDRGEFVAPERSVISLGKRGYMMHRVKQRLHGEGASETLYLTKQEDITVAEYEYRLEYARRALSHLSVISYELRSVLLYLPKPNNGRERGALEKLCKQVASLAEKVVARTPEPCQKCEAVSAEIRDFDQRCTATGAQ